MAYAKGKYAKAISDRSGMEFPYTEMVKEWNGSFVHRSEYESKHPQIRRRQHQSDPIALQNPRPLRSSPTDVDLNPALFASFETNSQTPPDSADEQNKRRQIQMNVGDVTVTVS